MTGQERRSRVPGVCRRDLIPRKDDPSAAVGVGLVGFLGFKSDPQVPDFVSQGLSGVS